MSEDGSGKRVLAKPSDGSYSMSISPDGNRVVYDVIGTKQIMLLDLRTGVETQLTQGPQTNWGPVWSPDGTSIAYFRAPGTSANGSGIAVMRPDGVPIREVAPGGYAASGLDWSPDGRWLAATTLGDSLVLIEAATGTIARVITTGAGRVPNFSPDGKEIAYNVQNGNNLDIFVSNVDGSNRRQVTTSTRTDSYHYGPRWSPDGKLLSYMLWAPWPLPDSVAGNYAVALVSRTGAPVKWKDGVTVYGYLPLWRRTP